MRGWGLGEEFFIAWAAEVGAWNDGLFGVVAGEALAHRPAVFGVGMADDQRLRVNMKVGEGGEDVVTKVVGPTTIQERTTTNIDEIGRTSMRDIKHDDATVIGSVRVSGEVAHGHVGEGGGGVVGILCDKGIEVVDSFTGSGP